MTIRRFFVSAAIPFAVILIASGAVKAENGMREESAQAAPTGEAPPPLRLPGGSLNTRLAIDAFAQLASLSEMDRRHYLEKLRETLAQTRKELSAAESSLEVARANTKKAKELSLSAGVVAENVKAQEDASEELNELGFIESSLVRLLQLEDPDELSIDIYAATEWSTLFRDESSSGVFGKSRPYIQLETRQVLGRDENKNPWEVWGRVSLQTAAFAPTPTPTPTPAANEGRRALRLRLPLPIPRSLRASRRVFKRFRSKWVSSVGFTLLLQTPR